MSFLHVLDSPFRQTWNIEQENLGTRGAMVKAIRKLLSPSIVDTPYMVRAATKVPRIMVTFVTELSEDRRGAGALSAVKRG